MGFFPHSPFSMDSSFPSSHDHNRNPLGGGSVMMNGVSFSESLRTLNAIELLQREQERERIREEEIREQEKERIREEIREQERVRIQTLEEEVRKELAIERELKLQQAKPTTPTLAKIKGRVVTVGVDGLPHKKLACDLCQVNVRSEIDLRAHILGKKHKEKLEAAPKADAEVSSQDTSNKNKVAAPGAGILSTPKRIAYKEWTCHLCDVSMSCDQALIDHINGKKHRARKHHRYQMKLQGQ